MSQTSTSDAFLDLFRQSSPYIQTHRNKIMVVCLPGEAIQDPRLAQTLHDLALINSLGIKLVLVHGIRPQVEGSLKQQGHEWHYHEGLRITDDAGMASVKEMAGAVRLEIEALLSKALANSPIPGAQTRTTSGNFITARPFGIHDGVDFMHTGVVRRVDAEGIRQQLDADAITLVSPIGFSPSGEIFNLTCADVAQAIAIALSADKLIMYTNKLDLKDSKRKLVRQLTQHEASQLLNGRKKLTHSQRQLLKLAVQSNDMGIDRVHILDWHQDGAILQELFTRDGVGTLISAEPYDTIRPAHTEDIPGILQIIELLEQAGVLIRRPRDLLEMEINQFLVAVRDDVIIGCAALYPYPKDKMAELACLAMDDAYQGSGGGEQLLKVMQNQAREQGINKLFVLTTQTAHWFKERGFKPAKLTNLPMAKRQLYNYQRKSKVFIKNL